MKQERRTVTGWIIPPSRTITLRDIIEISRQVGGRIHLKYNARRREFIAYTTAGEAVQQKLSVLLDMFRTQKITI